MAARTRRVVWSAAALRALDEVVGYIAEESPAGAPRVLEQVIAAADSLATLSERGRVVPEIADTTVREIFVFRYRLIYEVARDEVRILSFLHGSRDFLAWNDGE